MNQTNDINDQIRDNEKLVWFTINKYYPPEVRDDEDIYQAGMIGLWKGIKYFDESKGTKFSTFAVKCIRNEISGEFRRRNRFNSLDIISLDEPLNDYKGRKEELYLGDFIQDPRDFIAEIDNDPQFIIDRLRTDNHKITFSMLVDGYNGREISKVIGCTPAGAYSLIKRVQARAAKIAHENAFL